MTRAASEASRPDGLTAKELALLLSRAGAVEVTAADVRGDVAAGAPATADGRIPLVAYIRWLHLQVVTLGA